MAAAMPNLFLEVCVAAAGIQKTGLCNAISNLHLCVMHAGRRLTMCNRQSEEGEMKGKVMDEGNYNYYMRSVLLGRYAKPSFFRFQGPAISRHNKTVL